MNEADMLRLERDLLEFRLAMLERAIETLRLEGMQAPGLAERITAVFAQLQRVNAKLAELRGPAASTYSA